jgi:hexosaminidase
MESYIMPRLLGLAERAWVAQPEWVSIEDVTKREATLNADWNQFVNTLGQQELPRLDYQFGGVGYRVPLVGAKVIEGKVNANVVFAGLTIRYTTDGSEPTKDSPEYTAPFEATAGTTLKFKAFATNERSSRTSVLEVK